MISEKDIFKILGRDFSLFSDDLKSNHQKIKDKIRSSKFLIIGGAGSIGRKVVSRIFNLNPLKIHVVDINENNLVNLVRELRSSTGYIDGDFETFTIDCGSRAFEIYAKENFPFDFVLNFSALKHVRNEKDPYTLYRMIEANILNTIKTLEISIKFGATKYFSVSTDKVTNPVNMMGASKRIMEMFLKKASNKINTCSARFANVAFSDGSLLDGFLNRLNMQQPLSAPNDIKRYFITPNEAADLCIMSCILGKNEEIFFPNVTKGLELTSFTEITKRFLEIRGFKIYRCESEKEALFSTKNKNGFIQKNLWPCYFFSSDTTGEKEYEEFYSMDEYIDLKSFENIGITKNNTKFTNKKLELFLEQLDKFYKKENWNRKDLLDIFGNLLPEFYHLEKGKFLESRM